MIKKIKRQFHMKMLAFLLCVVSLLGNYMTAQASGITTGLNQPAMPVGTKQPEVSADTDQPGTPIDSDLSQLAAERSIMALVSLCEEADVRSRASQDSAVLAKAAVGQTVFIQDAVYNEEEGILWINAEFTVDGVTYRGYIERYLLACSDERFLAW